MNSTLHFQSRARSYWLDDALRQEVDVRVVPLAGDVKADICIVGGGYAGLWSAIRLKEADNSLRIAIVESDICGGGASGRNSGMVISQWPKIATLEALCGVQDALRLGAAFASAGKQIDDFCRAEGFDIDYQPSGWLWGMTHASQIAHWKPMVNELRQRNIDVFRDVDRSDIDAMLGREHCFVGGVFDPTAATLHPGKLARALRAIAIRRGIQLFERSPMQRFSRHAPLKVSTPSGNVFADKILLTMNAWSCAISELRSSIFVIASDDAMTAPIPDRLAEIGYTNGPLIGDMQVFIGGFRTTRDGRFNPGIGGGRIALGQMRTDRFDGPSRREKALRDTVRRTLPSMADVAFESSWSGPIDRTRSGLPILTKLPGAGEVYVGYGYSGNGLPTTFVTGNILASLVLGKRDEWSTCGLVRPLEPWLPPEPFRFVGAHAIRTAIRRRDRLSHLGRKPGLLVRALCALSPGGVTTSNVKSRSH